jgi:caa(3)-type oxidase subunit IV
MGNHAEHHPTGYKQYVVIWGILLVMTLVALLAAEMGIPKNAKALILVTITLAKILVIAAYFMHLKAEKFNLIILTISPIILAIVMFLFTYGEVGGSATHIIMVR